jgi:serine O-acetyltransferase
MLDTIKADLYRYVPHEYSLGRLLRGLRTQGFRYMFFSRLVEHYGMASPMGFVAKLMLRRYTYRYGFQLRGVIGKGFYIGHFGTIVMSDSASIGENCNVAHGVTIGETFRGAKAGSPTIGNKVWIGTNAVIVGRITIGSNVLIAPGAYVNFDVPDHSIVMGNPGQVTARENPTEGYIRNCAS